MSESVIHKFRNRLIQAVDAESGLPDGAALPQMIYGNQPLPQPPSGFVWKTWWDNLVEQYTVSTPYSEAVEAGTVADPHPV